MNAISMRLGTRRSTLATTQSGWVAQCLRDLGHDVDIVEITTFGDTSTAPLSSIGGTGVFVTAIRKALLGGEIDVAVHSLKDLPVAPEPGLRIAAIPVREDPRDAVVARDGLTLGKLPSGSVVGTGSPRRVAQLTALGLEVSVMDIRGNVDTRISVVHDGACDAVLLAHAGLARLGRLDEVTESLDPQQMLPAPGQGALAVECREDRPDVIEALSALDDPDTRAAVSAERALLAALEAGEEAVLEDHEVGPRPVGDRLVEPERDRAAVAQRDQAGRVGAGARTSVGRIRAVTRSAPCCAVHSQITVSGSFSDRPSGVSEYSTEAFSKELRHWESTPRSSAAPPLTLKTRRSFINDFCRRRL